MTAVLLRNVHPERRAIGLVTEAGARRCVLAGELVRVADEQPESGAARVSEWLREGWLLPYGVVSEEAASEPEEPAQAKRRRRR